MREDPRISFVIFHLAPMIAGLRKGSPTMRVIGERAHMRLKVIKMDPFATSNKR